MAQYDGVIRIVTDIATKDAKESLSSLEYQIKKSAKEINSLRSKMDALKDKKVPTKEFKDLQDKLSKAEKEMEKMLAQDSKFANLDVKIKKLSQSAADLAEKMKGAEVRIPTEEYKTLENAIDKNKTELESLLKEQKDLAKEGIGKGADKQYLVAAEAVERLKYELQQAAAAGNKDLYYGIEDRLGRAKSVLQELMAKEPRPLGRIQYYYAIEHKIKDLKSDISATEDEMRKLSEAGKNFTVNTDSPEYQKLASKYESVNQELEKTKSLHSEIAQKQAESVQKVAELKARIGQLVKEGKDFTLGQDTAEFASYARQIQYEEKAIEEAGRHYNKLLKSQSESYKKLIETIKKFSETVKKSFSSIYNGLKKVNSVVNSFGARIKNLAQKHLPLFRKESEKAKNSLSGFGNRLKSLALSLLIFNQLRKIFSASTSAIREGFENLYNENEKFRNSIENLKASLVTLKNALAAAFAPIVEIAIPYIQSLVEWLMEAVNLIGQFIAALTGRKTYTKAIRQSAKASEDAADAIEDETDAMNKQLSSLDKLNNLTSQNNKDKTGSSAGAGSAGGTMFEEVPIESSILDAADKVKDILSELFKPLKEAWDREGQFVMDSWKYALEEVWKLIKDIGRDFLTVWQEDATVDILANILHIIGDIGLIVGHLARNFREAWNENEVGLNILRNIRDIIGIIVQHIRNAADATVEWADKLDFYPILDAFNRFLVSIKPVVDAVWGILEDFYTHVLLPLAKWTIEKGLPELLQVFIDFNKKVDWESLRENIAEFWNHLEPFAETVGEGLIIFIDRVSDALAGFINSDSFKNFLKTVEDWMDSVSPEDVADAITKLAEAFIALKLALLGFTAIKGIVEVVTVLKNFFSLFSGLLGILPSVISIIGGLGQSIVGLLGTISAPVAAIIAAIGSLVAGMIYVLKTNDEVRQGLIDAIQNVWNALKNLWENVLVPLISLIADVLKPIIDVVIGLLKELWQNVIVPLAEVILSVLTQALNGFADIINNVVVPVLNTVIEVLRFLWNTVLEPLINFLIDSFAPAFDSAFGMIKALIEDFGEVLSGLIDFIIGVFTGDWKRAWEGIKEIFKGVWDGFKDVVKGVLDAILSLFNGFRESISSRISSISDSFNKLKSQFNNLKSSVSSKASGLFRSFSFDSGIQIPVSPVVAALSNVEIPAYATGQVIPRTMKQHLAILGDNSQETEVVSPLSTIEQAVENAIIKNGGFGGGDTYLHLVVECEGHQLLELMQKLDRQFYKQNGRHAFS